MSDIKMVSNLEGTHLEELKKLFRVKSNRLVIVSPFLASDIGSLLNEFSFEEIEVVELVTTLKPKDPEQLSKPKQLKSFFQHFIEKYPRTKFKLHIDNNLHGKIYVRSAREENVAILGSANFTRNGLCNNHEWSVSLNNIDVIEDLLEDIFGAVEYPEVTYDQINKACLFSEQYERDNPEWKVDNPNIHCNILDNVYSVEDSENTDPKYFLKPIGHSESPVLLEDKRDFSDLHQNLHFSKKRPKGVMKGDVVITAAVGGGAFISYFKVTGGLQHVTDEEISSQSWKQRWPWYMEGRNQSQGFSSMWWSHNIQRKDVLSEFREKYPDTPVTYAGGFGLGTLNMGNDKVRITKEFGSFIISKIEAAVG